ncbi:UNVERIFIED_CONTAM: hypothetical protein ABIC26_002249 [Paenibacillus sp. PvR008]
MIFNRKHKFQRSKDGLLVCFDADNDQLYSRKLQDEVKDIKKDTVE